MEHFQTNHEHRNWPCGHIPHAPGVDEIKGGLQQICSHAFCDKKATHFAQVTLGQAEMSCHLVFCFEHARMAQAICYLDWILEEDEPPEAEVVAEGHHWRILECPYCGQEHLHGRDEPEDDSLGHRLAHCGSPGASFSQINSKGYILVKAEQPPYWPEPPQKSYRPESS